MPAVSSCRSPSSFTCSPHKGGTVHLLLSRPCSGFATEPHIEDKAVLVHGPPEPVLPAGKGDHHLIEMPAVAGPRSASADEIGIFPAKLLGPTTNRLVTDLNSTGGEHLLDHPQAQWKAEIEPDREADYLGRGTVASVKRGARLLHTASYASSCSHLVNVTMPSRPRVRGLPGRSEARRRWWRSPVSCLWRVRQRPMWGSSSGTGPTDLSTPICWIGASVRVSQVASTVNGIVLSHSQHRIQRSSRCRGPHRPQYEIHPRWKAQTLSTGSLARPHGPYRERSFHPAPDAQRTAGILLRP
jgi:hypothetical protein